MRSAFRRRPALWYWMVALGMTLWGMAGVANFYVDMTRSDAALQAMDAYDRAFHAALPGWFSWVYAVATWAGLLGGIALLLRRRWAIALFALSLVAILVQFGWVFLATDLAAAKGWGATLPFPLFIAAVAVCALWAARHAERRGWLR